jgi:hypothetical protein
MQKDPGFDSQNHGEKRRGRGKDRHMREQGEEKRKRKTKN